MRDHDVAPDTDGDARHFSRGPGRRRRTRDPVIEVYADGAIDRPCATCGAEPLSFCRWPDGTQRKLPCLNR